MNMKPLEKPVIINGQFFPAGTEMFLSETTRVAGEKAFDLSKVRHTIDTTAGDSLSREGVVSDVLAVVLVNYCELVEKLATAKTVEAVREATSAQLGFSKAVNDAIRGGALRLPYAAKGLDQTAVLDDLKALSNKVSDALAKDE